MKKTLLFASLLSTGLVFAGGETEKKNDTPVEVAVAEDDDKVVIDEFDKAGTWSWWGSSAVKKGEIVDGALKFTVTNAGDPSIDGGYSTFGRDHSMETLDFTQYPVVKLRVKVSGDEEVKIRLNVKDIDDYVNNEDNIVKTVKPGEFQDLYFDFQGKWGQSWPTSAEIDPEEIKEFLIFVNPGGPKWSGELYIDELSIVAEKP